MSIELTEEDIDKLLKEKKTLPANYLDRFKLKPKKGHSEGELIVRGENGNEFHVILRQSLVNYFDFSVILAYRQKNSNKLFRLRRYNGKHQHTNKIEGQTIDAYHIHYATVRYQEIGMREDSYAEATDRYSDIEKAKYCMLQDCNFELLYDPQGRLFKEL